MVEKPELIAFSENKLGGVQSFYHNLLSNDPTKFFNCKWIFTDNIWSKDAKLPTRFGSAPEIIFRYGISSMKRTTERLSRLLSNEPGVILTNHELELLTLCFHKRENKTIFYFCHDELYLTNAVKYEFLIDAYVAHNYAFWVKLKEMLPAHRSKDIFYIPYGITPALQIRKANTSGILRILFVARLDKKKGVYDLSKIDDELLARGVRVDWTVLGDGPEKAMLTKELQVKSNFKLSTPGTTQEILSIAANNDVFVLPSYLDGVPVALLETMSAGLVPVISKFNDGISRIVTPSNGFIVPVGDNEAFAETLTALNSNRSLLQVLSENARRTIVDNFDVKDRAREYFRLFSEFRALKKEQRNVKVEYPGFNKSPLLEIILRALRHRLKPLIG
jgi:glycosyltransferase involved in cell wall biosynthesis